MKYSNLSRHLNYRILYKMVNHINIDTLITKKEMPQSLATIKKQKMLRIMFFHVIERTNPF